MNLKRLRDAAVDLAHLILPQDVILLLAMGPPLALAARVIAPELHPKLQIAVILFATQAAIYGALLHATLQLTFAVHVQILALIQQTAAHFIIAAPQPQPQPQPLHLRIIARQRIIHAHKPIVVFVQAPAAQVIFVREVMKKI